MLKQTQKEKHKNPKKKRLETKQVLSTQQQQL